jgi:hypothetical protein
VPCSSRTHPARSPQPAPALLARRARLPHPAVASPHARARPPALALAGFARPTCAPASPRGCFAPRTCAFARLSLRLPHLAHVCPPQPAAASPHACTPVPASHAPCSPPREHIRGLGLGLENFFSSIAVSGWGTRVSQSVCLGMLGWGYYKRGQCCLFLLLSIFNSKGLYN